ncbi:MAG: hypothetical protein R6W73_01030 [Candidatus Saliniplasma sp.]
MPNMTLPVSKELKDMIDKHPEINRSEVARRSFMEKLTDLEFLEELNSLLSRAYWIENEFE